MAATPALTPPPSMPFALTASVPPRATLTLDLDAMAAIAVDAGRLAANDAAPAPMMSPAYYDAVVSLPVDAPARAAAARLFAACYDGALNPATG